MAGNSYTWTCPRCKYVASTTLPSVPDNCPRCNYPDEQGDAELESEIGPEAQLTGVEKERLDAAVERLNEADAEQDARGQTFSTGDAHLPDEPGWLGEVLREVVGKYLAGTKTGEIDVEDEDTATLGDIVNFDALDWEGAAEAVIERYNQPRPVLLCGCKAGTHGRSFEDMGRAHPERTT